MLVEWHQATEGHFALLTRDNQEDAGKERPHVLRQVKGGNVTDDKKELVEEMFVQVAAGATGTGKEVTLNGVSPMTLYFSDRPERIVGHLTNEQLFAQWADGGDSFAADPPNAVLSFAPNDGEMPNEAVVVPRDPQLGEGSLTYHIDVLEGAVPSAEGACTLFIDPLGRPLSPVSVMGVRRRQRRRVRRRLM
jgi:hypothetical protein